MISAHFCIAITIILVIMASMGFFWKKRIEELWQGTNHHLSELVQEFRKFNHQFRDAFPKKPKSGTIEFEPGGMMDITVQLTDVAKRAVAVEWDAPGGTGNRLPAPTGTVNYTSDNPAAVTVDPTSGQLAYVATGIANISFTDILVPNLVVQAGSVTVIGTTPGPAVSGTVEFV